MQLTEFEESKCGIVLISQPAQILSNSSLLVYKNYFQLQFIIHTSRPFENNIYFFKWVSIFVYYNSVLQLIIPRYKHEPMVRELRAMHKRKPTIGSYGKVGKKSNSTCTSLLPPLRTIIGIKNSSGFVSCIFLISI